MVDTDNAPALLAALRAGDGHDTVVSDRAHPWLAGDGSGFAGSGSTGHFWRGGGHHDGLQQLRHRHGIAVDRQEAGVDVGIAADVVGNRCPRGCTEPAFQVGLPSEKLGIKRAGARLVATVCLSEMPWCTAVIGRLYGVGGQCHHRPSGMFRRYAWPSARWGSMHISGGVSETYRREIETASDPAAKQAEIEARLNAIASPFRTAEATGQDIIDPRQTRALLCDFVEDAQRVIASQRGTPSMPYLP